MNDGISIIIPAYKAQSYIQQCINSIEKEKSIPIEIIIGIDNCNETLDFLNKNRDNKKIYYFKSNIGPYLIKNSLIDHTKYDNVVFFDADDVMNDNMLSSFYKEINNYNCIKFKYANFTKDISVNKGLHTADAIIGIKKEIFCNLNGFYPWMCSADSEFSFRLIYNKISCKTLDGISFYRRLHDNNLTVKKETNFKSQLRKNYLHIIKQRKQANFWPNPEIREVGDYYEL